MQLRAGAAVESAVAAIGDYANLGINPATKLKDERAWLLWSRMCNLLGTAAVRTAEDVREYPGRVTFLLTSLMVYARMWCLPKEKGQAYIRPKSCLAYPLAVIRIYKRWGIALPGYKHLCACLQGMCRAYVNHHGPESLTPKKAEPIRFEMSRAIFDIEDGQQIGTMKWNDDDDDVFNFRRANLFAMSSGARLAALAGRTALMRGNAVWTFRGVVYTDPEPEQLEGMCPGDQVTVSPQPEKCDQYLEVHAHFPYTFIFGNERYNVAAALRDIELRFPCRGKNRKSTALFKNPKGEPYSHNFYVSTLRLVLTHLYGEKTASLFTWHGYRSGLATALHAAGVSDEVIMLMCHWVAPESLRSYRRLSASEQMGALQRAAAVPVNLLQPRNAPVVSGDQHYAMLHAAFGRGCANPSPPAGATNTPGVAARPDRHAHREVAQTTQERAVRPAVRTSPCTSPPEVGEEVFIPRETWPTYACSEFDGLGWAATVCSATSRTAVVRFTNATTAAGRFYQNVRLPLRVVHRVDPGAATGCPEETACVRGGCREAGPPEPPPQSSGKGAVPPVNAVGYPQLVQSDRCALCKRKLRPIDKEEGGLPTRVATRERLQCERCGRVRYCDEWCAHVHYEACHKHWCPLPPFDTEFNAEYIVRRGRHVRAIPVHCVRTELINGGGLNAPSSGWARTHVWSAVPHAQEGKVCKFCDEPGNSSGALHHVWFVALITRLRHAETARNMHEIDWSHMPRWSDPVCVYDRFPAQHGRPEDTWPPAAVASRHQGTAGGGQRAEEAPTPEA